MKFIINNFLIKATLFESFNEKREIEQTIIETENAKNKV